MTNSIIFPSDPFNDRTPDEAFGNEATAARWANIPAAIVDHNTLYATADEVEVRKVPETGSRAFYRGWMMNGDEYRNMFEAFEKRGVSLITTPENYIRAHYLPGWIDVFDGLTPRSIILPENPDKETILRDAEELQVTAYIVKDFVKSRKHEWDTACYAPSLHQLPAIVEEFIRLQEDSLVGSVVVREFVELDKTEPEVRVWWAHTVPVLITAHPDDPDSEITQPSEELLYAIKERVEILGTPFITTDLAKKADGEWIVIEVGDGQVSGLPTSVTEKQMETLFTSVVSF